jgi:hypothetical protein
MPRIVPPILRDEVKTATGARLFSRGLYSYIYGINSLPTRFGSFAEILSKLPRKQTRVYTWPLQTVFGFIANPKEFIFLNQGLLRRQQKNILMTFIMNTSPFLKNNKQNLIYLKK